MTDPAYFDRLYDDSADPWDLSSSSYERRKLALLLASLPSRRYASAFEPGCSIGVTTAALAERCDRLVAVDVAPAAVARARSRVPEGHVLVTEGRIPQDWPTDRFDLIVLSEVLYYLDSADRRAAAGRAADSLVAGGDLLAVHWRPPFAEAATNGDVVHAELTQRLRSGGLDLTVDHTEEAFRLQVFHRADPQA